VFAKIISSIVVVVAPLASYIWACYQLRYDKYPDLPIPPTVILVALSSIGAMAMAILGLKKIWDFKL